MDLVLVRVVELRAMKTTMVMRSVSDGSAQHSKIAPSFRSWVQ